jgi:methyl-coenzyme M reductase subunit D
MTDTEFPQIRIVPERMLFPQTVERLLNAICETGVIRRMVLNGPRLPAEVPYGPARGTPNPHTARKLIKVADTDFELQVQVGVIVLELIHEQAIEVIRKACDAVFTDFPYQIQKGRFMKSQPTLTDYAKYGSEMDKDLLGMADPGKKGCPIILQGVK